MELNKQNMKKIMVLIAFAVLFYVAVQNWALVAGFCGQLLGYTFPFVLGACIAFILNVPMRFIETRLFDGLLQNKNSRIYKAKRPLSLVLTLVLVAGVLFLVVFLIVPALGDTLRTLAYSLPRALTQVQLWAYRLMDKYPEIAHEILNLDIDWREIGSEAATWLKNIGGSLVNSTIGVATTVVGSLVNFFLALIFSIYVLLQKEKLGRQFKGLMFAFLPEKFVLRSLYILSMAGETFSRFLSGQCMEAIILGCMFFVAMTVFGFNYALMISVLIAVLALVPIFGAFIGCFVGAFLLVIDDPIRALWFVIMFLILQQIEGNLIYPHVVGSSVGLPSIWVLAAVTVGGNAMGLAGMLIFIPLCSVLYALIRETVYKRLRRRYGSRYQELVAMRKGMPPKRNNKPRPAPKGKGKNPPSRSEAQDG